jgi:hypothetical protein
MRALLFVFLVACGGGASASGDPAAGIASLACDRLGPDGTGFMITAEYGVTLDAGQAFTAVFAFPTAEAPLNESNIYSCGAWSNTGFGGDAQGCQRDPGQASSSQNVLHSLAIEFPSPLPPPVTVTVTARVLPSPSGSMAVAEDVDTVNCN